MTEQDTEKHAEGRTEERADSTLSQVDTSGNYANSRLTVKTTLVYLALCLQYAAQMFNVVGSGAFARNIAAAIGGSDKVVWLSQAIVITTVVLGPPVTQASDYWGRKWFLVVGSVFGAVGALILARANTMGQAIGGQVVSSVLYIGQPLLIAVGSEILPRRLRPSAQAGLNATGGIGGIAGLLAGSALTSNNLYGWRNYWYITVALTGFSAITIATLYHPPPRPEQRQLTMGQKLGSLDWTGYALLAAGLVLFSMGLTWGNNPFPWTNAHVLAPLIVGLAIFAGFIVHQTLLKKDGLVHHDLFKKDRNFALALGCFLADGIVFWAANNYYTMEVSILYETDSVLAGLHYAITFFAGIVAAIVIHFASKFTKRMREPIVMSFLLFMIFFALMSRATLTSNNAVWGYPAILGFGFGWSLTLLVTAAQLSAPPELIAITSGLMLASRSLGGSIGLAIYTAIFNSSMSKHLGHDIAAAVLPAGLPPTSMEPFTGALMSQNQALLAQVPGVTPAIIGAGVHAMQGAYLKSFEVVWIAAAVFSGVTALASCFFINPTKEFNDHIDAPLEEVVLRDEKGRPQEDA